MVSLLIAKCSYCYTTAMNEPGNLTFRLKGPVFLDIHTPVRWHVQRENRTASLLIQAAATWHFKLEVSVNEFKKYQRVVKSKRSPAVKVNLELCLNAVRHALYNINGFSKLFVILGCADSKFHLGNKKKVFMRLILNYAEIGCIH